MRVFISHSSADKPAVVPLADALRARGIDAWLDQYQIAPFADIVARINAGLSPHRRAALPTDEPILVRLRERVQKSKSTTNAELQPQSSYPSGHSDRTPNSIPRFVPRP